LEQFPKSILVSNAAPKKDWNPGSSIEDEPDVTPDSY